MHATRAAVEEGVLPGGGVALLRAIKSLDKLKTPQRRSANRHRNRQEGAVLAGASDRDDADEDGSIVVGKILDKDTYAFGFDAQTGEYGNLVSRASSTLQSGPGRTPGRGLRRGSADYHRGDGCRLPLQAEPRRCRAARRRHGRNGRHGLLSRSIEHRELKEAGTRSGLLRSLTGEPDAHTPVRTKKSSFGDNRHQASDQNADGSI